ncbi:MAG TPA: glutamine-hydrolyzing carbamoyl-phosphate synthase small subunit [Gammaproteobacteria bacterium]
MGTAAILALEDGSLFRGESIGANGRSVGEVVFNTAITGYQEILTDPSYCSQIVTLTCPHIGNVGVNAEDEESGRIYAAGLVVRDAPRTFSSWRAGRDLRSYLRERNVVGIAGIDTRRLTRLLREKGAQNGCITAGVGTSEADAVVAARGFPGLKGMDLAREVSVTEAYDWREGTWSPSGGHRQPPENGIQWNIVAYDFGIKRNILRMLCDRGCRVTVVPAQTSAEAVLDRQPDGIFLSNGPGDPEPCSYAITAIRRLLDTEIPVFGICLGHQLLGLAGGARTVKMKFGHHGANHPVKALESGKVFITSQNHGFAVDESTLPNNIRATHRSLFDGSLQGIHWADRPVFGFQGHPEASPGPRDAGILFDHFIELMANTPSRVDA